jgi:hypothetical protein
LEHLNDPILIEFGTCDKDPEDPILMNPFSVLCRRDSDVPNLSNCGARRDYPEKGGGLTGG